MDLELKFDPEADAIYIRLNDLPYAFGEDLDPARRIDYAANGEPIGIELLTVSQGLNIHDLPREDEIARLVGAHSFKVFA